MYCDCNWEIGVEWHYIAPVKPMQRISSTAQLGRT
jgi:hypothetical protein